MQPSARAIHTQQITRQSSYVARISSPFKLFAQCYPVTTRPTYAQLAQIMFPSPRADASTQGMYMMASSGSASVCSFVSWQAPIVFRYMKLYRSTSVNNGFFVVSATFLGSVVMSSRYSACLAPLSLLPSWAMHLCRCARIMRVCASMSSFRIPGGKSLGDQDQEAQATVQSTSRTTQSAL